MPILLFGDGEGKVQSEALLLTSGTRTLACLVAFLATYSLEGQQCSFLGIVLSPELEQKLQTLCGSGPHCCCPLLELPGEDSLVRASVAGKWEVSEDVAGQADTSNTFCCRTGVDGKERSHFNPLSSYLHSLTINPTLDLSISRPAGFGEEQSYFLRRNMTTQGWTFTCGFCSVLTNGDH